MDWQPITTAPRGEWVLLWCPSGIKDRSYEVENAPPITVGIYASFDYQEAGWFSVESHSEFWDYGGMTGAGTSEYQCRCEPTLWCALSPPSTKE